MGKNVNFNIVLPNIHVKDIQIFFDIISYDQIIQFNIYVTYRVEAM